MKFEIRNVFLHFYVTVASQKVDWFSFGDVERKSGQRTQRAEKSLGRTMAEEMCWTIRPSVLVLKSHLIEGMI